MLKKSLETLKKNPVIIMTYLVVAVVLFLSVFFFMPNVNKIVDISNEITKNQANPSAIDTQIIINMFVILLKLFLFGFIVCVLGVIYMAGFGSMIAEAVSEGKTALKSFFTGIKKNIKKTILSFLLLIAFSIGLGILMVIISMPFSVFSAIRNINDTQAVYNSQRIIQALSSIIMIFAYPFVELWLPAIFMDKEDGVITSLKKGVKAGKKNYKSLVVVTAVLFLPSIGLLVFIKDMNSAIISPVYIATYVYQVIVAPIVIVYLFNFYKASRQLKQNIQQ